jgi:hypothetical protein
MLTETDAAQTDDQQPRQVRVALQGAASAELDDRLDGVEFVPVAPSEEEGAAESYDLLIRLDAATDELGPALRGDDLTLHALSGEAEGTSGDEADGDSEDGTPVPLPAMPDPETDDGATGEGSAASGKSSDGTPVPLPADELQTEGETSDAHSDETSDGTPVPLPADPVGPTTSEEEEEAESDDQETQTVYTYRTDGTIFVIFTNVDIEPETTSYIVDLEE